MAIAKMLRLKLVGINSEQDALLNALHATGAVELKDTCVFAEGEKKISDKSEIISKQEELEYALNLINNAVKQVSKTPVEPDGFAVSYSEFMAIAAKEQEILLAAKNARSINEEILKLKADILALKSEIAGYKPYLPVKDKFSSFKNTQKTVVRLGTIDERGVEKVKFEVGEMPLATIALLEKSERVAVIAVVCHVQETERVDKLLGENGFARCIYQGDFTALEKIEHLNRCILEKREKIELLNKDLLILSVNVKDMKILSDYLAYLKEKATSGDNFARTAHAFVLEGYVPEERKEQVQNAILQVSGNVYMEFDELGENDFAPTLMRNKKVASQFEFVTNLYSTPKYLSFDPNSVLAVFFSIFLGFITADTGYGILMAIGGFIYAKVLAKKHKTGTAKLSNVVAWGGLATIVFGVLFDSWFGMPLLQRLNLIQKPFLPDPIVDTVVLAGISIPSLLMICLGMGVIHIMAGLFITALIHFKHKRILDGICDGFIWIAFLAGLMLLVLSETAILPNNSKTAAIIMLVAVVLGALTAGRNVKGLGKFTKGFGAVYGLINYMSDILSYARLYGLMLSGAQIASIISNQLALPMLQSPGGVGGIIACMAIMLVGHIFNIAMGVLGAFIHDARLQYVEFFSRFYEGEGELFVPMGSRFNHIYLD
ncbi:MAG: V-type ATP synthase subunit I [Clostridia bacterium]|nr:V-type ATP synthase subunit I [Clostridia bacterium]